MDASGETMIRQLAPGESRVLMDMAGVEVRCLEGRIWLTQYGDDRDVVLEAGRAFVPLMSSAVVVSSSSGARLTLVRAAAVPRSRHGLWRRLLGLFDPRSGSVVTRQLDGRMPPIAPRIEVVQTEPAPVRAQRPSASRAFFASYSRIRSS